jgi:DNA-binding transcriptional regulator YhcF (GntR family)
MAARVKPPITISEGEILEALAVAKCHAPAEAESIEEMAKRTGLAPNTVRKALLKFRAEGRMQIHRRDHIALDGRRMRVPAYTITPKK